MEPQLYYKREISCVISSLLPSRLLQPHQAERRPLKGGGVAWTHGKHFGMPSLDLEEATQEHAALVFWKLYVGRSRARVTE